MIDTSSTSDVKSATSDTPDSSIDVINNMARELVEESCNDTDLDIVERNLKYAHVFGQNFEQHLWKIIKMVVRFI